MKKLDPADYQSVLRYIVPSACGEVYPRSIAEGLQHGDIFTEEDAVLLWHHDGFAFLYGTCGEDFLEEICQTFLYSTPERRFILFTDKPEIEQFFREKPDLIFGQRYHFTYPEGRPVPPETLPEGYTIRAFDSALFNSLQGRITPRFSWPDADTFLQNGMGYCIFCGEEPASWAFSAAVSAEELDIGVETAESYRHKGLATLAAEAMLRYCLNEGKRPIWSCDVHNLGSQRIAEKAGFVKASTYTTIRADR